MSERDVEAYLFKAEESLAGAAGECANARYNNCANRAYYAYFQAAIVALMREGISPPAHAGRWGHDFVQARFVGDLINRRRLYSPTLRETLVKGMRQRQTADYKTERVSAIQANRGLERARAFVEAVSAKGTARSWVPNQHPASTRRSPKSRR